MIKIKPRKGQSTVEYAIILGVVVAGLVAMQTYVKRGLQARYHDGTLYLANQTTEIGGSTQYEPYYLDSSYDATQTTSENELVTARGKVETTDVIQDRARGIGGFERQTNTDTAD